MDVELLKQADMVLGRCGRREAPRADLSAVYLPHSFLLQAFFPAATTQPTQTVTKEITGDVTWCLRDMQITSSVATAIYLQILKPDGRFLINTLQDVLQIAGYGSYRYLWTKELQCPPGSKISVTFQVTNVTNPQPIAILFGGAYLYLVKKTSERICPNEELVRTGSVPRYFGNSANQNIMAPCWQQGVGPYTPEGFEDSEFTYIAPSQTGTLPAQAISVTAANATATLEIQIEPASDFLVRRLLFFVTTDRGVTSGLFLCRIRDDSGYAFTDDYFDVERYINGSPMPKDWELKAGSRVFFDLALADQGGQGNMYFAVALEGVRRRRV